jgi:hypothetical protein
MLVIPMPMGFQLPTPTIRGVVSICPLSFFKRFVLKKPHWTNVRSLMPILSVRSDFRIIILGFTSWNPKFSPSPIVGPMNTNRCLGLHANNHIYNWFCNTRRMQIIHWCALTCIHSELIPRRYSLLRGAPWSKSSTKGYFTQAKRHDREIVGAQNKVPKGHLKPLPKSCGVVMDPQV